jgi:hypothetical protein
MTSLTLTDVSASMLQQAQRKYFDQLQLQYKQPHVQCRFVLADAQHLAAPPGEQPHTVLLSPYKETKAVNTSSKQAVPKSESKGMFRLKSRRSSSTSDSSSSNTDQGAGAADAAASQAPGAARPSTAAPLAASSSSISSSSSSSSNTDGHDSSSTIGSKKGWLWSNRSAATPEQDSAATPTTTSSSSSSTFAPHSFDTVVDTFGLCSCDDPVGVSAKLCHATAARHVLHA